MIRHREVFLKSWSHDPQEKLEVCGGNSAPESLDDYTRLIPTREVWIDELQLR